MLGRGSLKLKESHHGVLGFAFLVVVCVAEVLLLFSTTLFSHHIWESVAMHGFLVAVVLVWVSVRFFLHYSIAFPLFFAGSVAAMGPFGAFGSLAMIVLFRFLPAVSLSEWLDVLQSTSEDEDSKDKMLDRLARYRRVLNTGGTVMSFHEILMVGSVRQKQEVLGAIAHFFHPSFASLLKLSLNDSSSLVRTQAATTLTKVQNQFLQRLLQLEKKRAGAPNDFALWRELAEFYDSYAFAGILDSYGEMELRTKALSYYERYVEADPSHWRAMRAIGRIYFRNRNYERAQYWFELYLQRNAESAEVILWLAEIYYRHGDYDHVIAMLSTNAALLETRMDAMPMEVSEAVQFWQGSGV